MTFSNKPHFIIVPLPAHGHLIPMIDMGRFFAELGVHVSLIITRASADRIKPIIEGAKESKLSIEFVEFSFPSGSIGVSPECESGDHINNIGELKTFFDAMYALDEPLEDFIKSLKQPPNCMITDMFNAWTAPVARKFHIPGVIFHGPSGFHLSASCNLHHNKVFDSVTDANEYVTVPDFPVKLETTKAQMGNLSNMPGFENMRKMCLEEELTTDEVVINTFLELERSFAEKYGKVKGKKVWTIGPICHYNKHVENKMIRGNKEAIDQTH